VTGGASGLAKASAILLARAGCHVAIADLNDSGAAKTAEEVESHGRRAMTIHADVTQKDQVERMVQETIDGLGPLIVAANVVGSFRSGVKPFLDYSLEDFQDPFTMQLTTTLLCMQAEAVAMVREHVSGRIINFGSSSGVVGAPNISHYGAANAGVIHFTKSAAMELAPYGVRVNCVVPGTHWTENMRRSSEDPATSPGQREFIRQANMAPPLGRLGEPEETAGVVVFLASNLSAYVTGHAILSDGGVTHTTARPPVGLTMKPKALEGLV
jgi:NAD(P)-dependent dehydrogenase (short-subunit alcohol dehydrogenase family)